jgi:hypothetical protein
VEIYRLKFLNLDGRIKSFETFESNADDAARVYAAERLMARSFPTVELWHRSRRVFPQRRKGA